MMEKATKAMMVLIVLLGSGAVAPRPSNGASEELAVRAAIEGEIFQLSRHPQYNAWQIHYLKTQLTALSAPAKPVKGAKRTVVPLGSRPATAVQVEEISSPATASSKPVK